MLDSKFLLEDMGRTTALNLVVDELDCIIVKQALESLGEFARKDEGQTYCGLSPAFVYFRCCEIIRLLDNTFERYRQERGV
jgi:hypothetical protein